MTRRALILGVVGAAFICGVTFYNDMVIRGSFLVGCYLPNSVFGALILVLLVLNPVLARWRPKAAFSAAELGVILAMVLFSCSIPGRGLMHHFTTVLMLPHHLARTTSGWRGGAVPFSGECVTDWAKLAAALVPPNAGVDGTHTDLPASGRRAILAGVWEALPREDRATLRTGLDGATLSPELRRHVLEELNAALADPALPKSARESDLALPNHVRRWLGRAGQGRVAPDILARVNRGILEACLPGAIEARKPIVTEHVPAVMLADPWRDPGTALNGFVNGLGTGDEWISPAEVPWYSWGRTLLFWVPVILTTAVLVTGLALVVHRQWAIHERLPYPTVEFARALLPEQDGTVSAVFRNRLFWLGAAPVFLLYMNNYARTWWPEYLVSIKTSFDFWPLLDLFPVFRDGYAPLRCLFRPVIYFSVVGISGFLASDAAFSLGVAPYLYTLVTGIVAGYGITVGGAFLRPSINAFNHAGGYCAMFLVLLYTGRHYFRNVLRRSLGLPSGESMAPSAVWGGRAALVAGALLLIQLVAVGVTWYLGALYVAGAVVIYVVASRLLAEVGLFTLQPFFFPCVLIWGLLGVRAVGPDQLLMLSMVSSVILIYPRATTMPFIVCGLQFADRVRVRLGTVAGAGYGAFVVGLLVAIPVTLYIQYQYGALRAGDGWSAGTAPRLAFNATCAVRNQLAAQGLLEESLSAGVLDRLADIRPVPACVVGFAITFALTWLFTFLRHRFAWWPLHPVMFLVLASWQSTYVAFSFLIGWAVKAVVTKYGGATAYLRLRPLMIGLIAGELLAGLVPVVVGTVYYMVAGAPPPAYGFR